MILYQRDIGIHYIRTIFFLAGYSFPADPNGFDNQVEPPTVELVESHFNSNRNERLLKLKMTYKNDAWTNLRFSGPLLRWNITKELPPYHYNHYMIRHVAGHGITTWGLEVIFSGNNSITFDTAAFTTTATKSIQQELLGHLSKYTTHNVITSAVGRITL